LAKSDVEKVGESLGNFLKKNGEEKEENLKNLKRARL
jgi:hypothetical protein